MRRRKRSVAHTSGLSGAEAARRAVKYFNGERMQCCLCDREERADPDRESDWRLLEADGEPFYFCPGHFPADGASADEYRRAYEACLARIVEIRDERVYHRYREQTGRIWRPILERAWDDLAAAGAPPAECVRHLRAGVLSGDGVLGRILRELPDDGRFQRLTPRVIHDVVEEFVASRLEGDRA